MRHTVTIQAKTPALDPESNQDLGGFTNVATVPAAVEPISGGAAATLAWLNGWCAAYLVAVARAVGGLPIAQITSTRTLVLVLAGVFLLGAYAWPRWRRRSSSLST